MESDNTTTPLADVYIYVYVYTILYLPQSRGHGELSMGWLVMPATGDSNIILEPKRPRRGEKKENRLVVVASSNGRRNVSLPGRHSNVADVIGESVAKKREFPVDNGGG